MSQRMENHYSGMLVINKEPGYTSSDVVAKLRGILHMRKIGHTGTLDPMAEGVLPVCLGSATKLTELIADRDKEYVARLRLGVVTDTQDMTGIVLKEAPADHIREEAIRDAAKRFCGTIEQIPPMYSAVWSNGQRLYDLARKGVTVERQPRAVTISELEILSVDLPIVTMRVVCSKGTYIRTLCEDLGNALGTGGAMEHLLRTRVGKFTLEEALTLGQVQEIMDADAAEQTQGDTSNAGSEPVRCLKAAEAEPASRPVPAGRGRAIEDHIIPIDSFFADAPKVHVREEDVRFLQNGNPLSAANLVEAALPRSERIRVYDEAGEFWALYRYDTARRRIVPVKMLHETAAQGTRRE